MAESAALAGDLAHADDLLRAAARIQETELGPLHPDLANTLNNLAIVAEKAGRPGDAEAFYRRAVAIASASLPAGHPTLAASRQNLEDFCRGRGVPIDGPAVVVSPAGPHVSVREDAAGAARPTDVPPLPLPAPTASHRSPPALREPPRSLSRVVISLVVLGIAALLVTRLWPVRDASAPAPAASTAPPAAEPAPPPPAAPLPIEPARPPTVVGRDDDRAGARGRPPVPGGSSDAITLSTVQLCRTFSTSGNNWQCDPAGNSVPPGPIVLYTRVRSVRDAVVVHLWYRGNALRQSVRLEIRANATEGYRTYSRQTVNEGDDWRVEVRTAAGDLLYEQRLAVR